MHSESVLAAKRVDRRLASVHRMRGSKWRTMASWKGSRSGRRNLPVSAASTDWRRALATSSAAAAVRLAARKVGDRRARFAPRRWLRDHESANITRRLFCRAGRRAERRGKSRSAETVDSDLLRGESWFQAAEAIRGMPPTMSRQTRAMIGCSPRWGLNEGSAPGRGLREEVDRVPRRQSSRARSRDRKPSTARLPLAVDDGRARAT
jgi:hypothetical protein